MNKVLYTCITNDYDRLREVDAPGWVKLCFTDNPELTSKTWDVVQIENPHPLVHREIKICPHRYFDFKSALWIDGRTQVNCDLDNFVDGKTGVWLMEHPERDCIYQEAIVCADQGKDDRERIRMQMDKYINEGYPEHNGLCATGILYRNGNNQKTRDCMEAWYQEVLYHSVRDQLSFNYIAWKYKLDYEMFLYSDGFTFWTHKKPKKKQTL